MTASSRRSLIVVLPGIGGSVLARPDRPDDVVWDQGKADIADLEFHPDLRVQLEERDQDLAAARAANRELMARINIANPNR